MKSSCQVTIFLMVLFFFSAQCTKLDGIPTEDSSLLHHSNILKSVHVNLDQVVPTTSNRFFCRKSQCYLHESACSRIIPRVYWRAREARKMDYMQDPVSIVFIHHTVMDRCTAPSQCQQALLKVQDLHMRQNKWDDTGYSFVVGEDGNAYEARGFDRVGAHTLGWNNVSIAIAVMGNFSNDLPNGPALQAINDVIECGIALGKVMPDYKLYGHCDARPMFESPGRKFYRLIKTWPNYGHKMLVTATV